MKNEGWGGGKRENIKIGEIAQSSTDSLVGTTDTEFRGKRKSNLSPSI